MVTDSLKSAQKMQEIAQRLLALITHTELSQNETFEQTRVKSESDFFRLTP